MSLNLKQIPKTVKNILVLDPSSSHMAYTIATIDWSDNSMTIQKSGMIWCKGSWDRGQKFLYIHEVLNHLLNKSNFHLIDMVVSEQYFLNFKQKSNTSVIPTINGIVQMLCAKYKILYAEIPPPTWRSILGLKVFVNSKGERDWKNPTSNFVNKHVSIPDTVRSNITLKERNTPHDIADSIAITLSLSKYNNLGKLYKSNTIFTGYGYVEEFNLISKKIE